MSILFKEARAENFRAASRRPSDICYLVIHFTANDGDSAKNNADYFAREAPGASAHFFVDEREIWQSVKEKDIAWHCGTRGMYFHPYCRNANSLGIELCSRKRGEKYYFTPETVKNAQQFVRSLMKRYGIPTENVVRHYDVTHKNCPAPFVEDAGAWQRFKAGLMEQAKEDNMTEKQVKQLIEQSKTVFDTEEAVPEWGRATIEKLTKRGLLRGEDGKLALTEEMLRVFVVLDRAGAFGA
nr:N-acetylmuramoyl-L-alanine amidase [uncultured Agathobaculum sp.]